VRFTIVGETGSSGDHLLLFLNEGTDNLMQGGDVSWKISYNSLYRSSKNRRPGIGRACRWEGIMFIVAVGRIAGIMTFLIFCKCVVI
jgi:hypothetical protein